MAAMTTALTEFATNGNSRTYTTSGHAVSSPKLVIQRRTVPVGNQTVAESIVSVLHGATDDATTEAISERIVFEAKVRTPIVAPAAEVAAALVIFRDMVAGDEFGNTVTTQEFLS